ncbi:molybdate transport system substrate-binding protein [Luteibacter sp. Sphag1AF]|uniref:molybdate ABC transporter substrate-binding protein n=1 Tax=Luteibacter sp. Sphag1AF TaxID=2587031 RepID=UPI00161A994B|nr:molybdate ABC transporter substrate-binding protein [Luteibacter sp. Sphag1AF]MBB3226526.1 molybdate transport system substrate-binding protein [Luteibacter sp. Sphag1AF]
MRRPVPRLLFAVVLATAAVTASAGDLVVSAASSLTDAFQAVGKAYEAKHPDTHVVLNFAASDILLRQISQGAPADVFASADQTAMDKAVSAKAVDPATRRDFATNALVLIVPAAGKLSITGPADLIHADVHRVAYGDPGSVPVGRYTQAALEASGLWKGVSAKGVLAQNVRQSLDYVARGEVDAGFVFATDASVMKDKVRVVAVVPTPRPISYPLAVVAGSKQQADARAFGDFVLSAQGQSILRTFGFRAP